jgi:hypothetical protein
VSPDSSTVFVTGSTGSGASDYATVAYDAIGGYQLWVRTYNGPGNGTDGGATAIGVSPDGSAVFVTGESYSTTSQDDYATLAYSIS